jgi:hypothetical protein
MSTVIDSLVVMLGLDSSDLTKKAPGASQALDKIEKSGEKVEKTVKQTSASVTDLSRGFTTLLGIIGGTVAFKSFLTDFVATNAQLDRLSKNLGISVPTISAWSNATEALGGSAQGLQGTLDMLSKSQTQLMLTGESSLIPYLSALGVSMADTTGKARPVTAILLDLADRFSHMDRTSANNMGRMMGIDQGTLNLLLQGRKELELQIARQKEHNAVTQKQAEAAQRLQTSIVGVKQGFEALGRSMLMQAMPAIEGVLHIFQRFVSWGQENREFIVDFLKVMAVGLVAIAIATAPIDLTVVAILALGIAIALLWQDYQTWKSGGDSFIDWAKWVADIKAVMPWIDALIDKLKEFNSWYEKLTGAKATSQLKSGMSALAYGAGVAIGVKGLKNPSDTADTKEARQLRQMKLMSYFQSQGWSPAQSAGIVANLMKESEGRTNAVGDNGAAYGIGQWHKSRQDDFAKWSGHSIQGSSLADQAAFYNYELTKGKEKAAGNLLRATTTAAQAGAVVSRYDERPSDKSGQAVARGEYAQTLWMQGISGAASMAAAAPQTGLGSSASGGNSTQLTINQMDIHTQATDADKIAKDMYQSLNYQLVGQANFGVR